MKIKFQTPTHEIPLGLLSPGDYFTTSRNEDTGKVFLATSSKRGKYEICCVNISTGLIVFFEEGTPVYRAEVLFSVEIL